jgi:DNA polymerase III sliding clamp (beta) subunit (PCNA family)
MNRQEFVRLLELVAPALSDADLVPMFTHYMLCDGAVSASNDALTIIAKSKLVETHGAVFAIKGTPLIGLLKNSSAEEVSIEEGKDNEALIKTGRSVLKLPYLPQTEFLFEEPKKEKWAATFTIDEDLIKGIKLCLTTACRDNSMPAIMGVCFNLPKTLYSCDGDAISRYQLTKRGSADTGSFTIPNQFCDALLKICSETETYKGELHINPNWAQAVLSNGFIVYGRMIENDKALDHAALIKRTMTNGSQFVPLPVGFDEALARARVLADYESKPTVLTVKGSKLLMATDTSIGTVRDELSLRGHEPVEATVHASLVQRSASVCDQISIRENCSCYKLGDIVLQIVSNIGE